MFKISSKSDEVKNLVIQVLLAQEFGEKMKNFKNGQDIWILHQKSFLCAKFHLNQMKFKIW